MTTRAQLQGVQAEQDTDFTQAYKHIRQHAGSRDAGVLEMTSNKYTRVRSFCSFSACTERTTIPLHKKPRKIAKQNDCMCCFSTCSSTYYNVVGSAWQDRTGQN